MKGPFCEAFVDISVSPPESVRKTDFSWITVNEWFNSQAGIITSHAMLKKANAGIDVNRLRGMVFAKRVGAADIIRIAARSHDKPETLVRIADAVTKAYISTLNNSMITNRQGKEPPKTMSLENSILAYSGEINNLRNERERLKVRLKLMAERLSLYNARLNSYFADPERSNGIKNRISRLEETVSALTPRINSLREKYTDNWPELSELNKKIAWMEAEKIKLDEELKIALKYDENKKILLSKVQKAKTASDIWRKQLDILKLKLEDLEARKGAAEDKLEYSKFTDEIYDMGLNNTRGYLILNPPTINLFPSLGWQLVYGSITGSLIWAGIYLIFSGKKKR